MAVGVLQRAGAVAVELVGGAVELGRAGRDRAVVERVDVLGVEQHRGRQRLVRLGAAMPEVLERVVDVDQRVADAQLGVHELVAHDELADDLGAEGPLVEPECFEASFDDEAGRDRAVTVWDGLD